MRQMGLSRLLVPDIKQILAEGSAEGLGEALADLHAPDVAEILSALEEHERLVVFQALPDENRALVFEHLDEESQVELVDEMATPETAAVLGDMSSDDRAELVRNLPEAVQTLLLNQLPRDDASNVRRLIAYPEDTAAAVMTTEFASIPATISAGEALDHLRRVATTRETIYYTYVVNDAGLLKGVITLTELVLAPPQSPVGEIMHTDVVVANAELDQEEVASMMAKYDFIALPVTDNVGRLLGIITHDDVLDILAEEQTEDAQLMGAVQPLDDPYIRTPFWTLIQKRGSWLALLFIVGLGTCFVLSQFEEFFNRFPFLAFFIPLVISSGGNAGSQSATLIVRAIAVGELRLQSWSRVVGREILLGVALGAVLGGLGLLAGPLFMDAGAKAQADPWFVAQIIAITVISVVTTGTFCGSLIPLLLDRLGWDPAVMSTPFVASIIDVAGIVIYMVLASWILPSL